MPPEKQGLQVASWQGDRKYVRPRLVEVKVNPARVNALGRFAAIAL
ncbi:hypothetical protein QT970_26890 [Microcoleus sp. herbarium8]